MFIFLPSKICFCLLSLAQLQITPTQCSLHLLIFVILAHVGPNQRHTYVYIPWKNQPDFFNHKPNRGQHVKVCILCVSSISFQNNVDILPGKNIYSSKFTYTCMRLTTSDGRSAIVNFSLLLIYVWLFTCVRLRFATSDVR